MEPTPQEITALLKALKDSSVYLRQRAAKNLARVNRQTLAARPEIAVALANVLADSNKYVRVTAALTLARLAPENPIGLESLQQLVADEHRDVRAAALTALKDLGLAARSALPAVEAALNDPSPAVRQQAEEAAARIRGE